MVATDVASRGIGMITTQPSLPPPSYLSSVLPLADLYTRLSRVLTR